MEKKCLYIIFWQTRRLLNRGENIFFAILQHEQQVIAYCQTHFDYETFCLLSPTVVSCQAGVDKQDESCNSQSNAAGAGVSAVHEQTEATAGVQTSL